MPKGCQGRVEDAREVLELVSKLPECDDQACNMDKCLEHCDFAFISHDQAAEVLQPSDRAFDFPATFISSQLAAVLRFAAFVPAIGADQVDSPTQQAGPHRIGVGGSVINQSLGVLSRSAATGTRHANLFQQRLDQRHFVGRRRGKCDSERHTLAVCHHHKLCTLAAFGRSDAGAPFFAEENVPSANTSCQSSCPAASNFDRKARHRSSQMWCSSQSRSRRQHVLLDGYTFGKSFQRAPLRSTHKMPSKQSRSAAGVRPPFGFGFRFGNNFSIFAHWSSVSSGLYSAIERLLSMAIET